MILESLVVAVVMMMVVVVVVVVGLDVEANVLVATE